jgi:hypothetical protein
MVGTQNVSGQSTIWRSQISVFMAGFQPLDDNQVRPNTGRTPKQIIEAGAVPPNRLPRPPIGAGVFTLIAGDMLRTIRAPWMSDEERRQLVKSLPDKSTTPKDEHPTLTLLPSPNSGDAAPSASSLSAAPSTNDADLARWLSLAPSTAADEVAANAAPAKTEGSAAGRERSVFNLPFSGEQIAEITARICAGEKKTRVVKSMPSYHTTRHREFSGYYDTIYSWLKEKGLVKGEVVERPVTPELMAG